MPYSEPIPVEDATRIDDDGTYCDVLLAAASRGIARRTGDELPKVIAGLYDCGYALVKVLPERPAGTFDLDGATVTLAQLRAAVDAHDGDYDAAVAQLEREVVGWRDTETGWRESTDGKWATAWAEGEGPGDCPVCKITEPHAHALRPGGSVDPAETRPLPTKAAEQ